MLTILIIWFALDNVRNFIICNVVLLYMMVLSINFQSIQLCPWYINETMYLSLSCQNVLLTGPVIFS